VYPSAALTILLVFGLLPVELSAQRVGSRLASQSGAQAVGSKSAVGGIGLRVLLHEVLPMEVDGFDRELAHATFGLPFPLSAGVAEIEGRPALSMAGVDAYQFRTLETWADGSVRWALCDVAFSLDAGETAAAAVRTGSGVSSTVDLALIQGPPGAQFIAIDTGPLQVEISTASFDLLQRVVVDGNEVLSPGAGSGIVATTPAGAALVASPDTHVTIEENGPVRAVVRADGALVDASGDAQVEFTCRLSLRRDSRDVEVTFTVRNATASLWKHAVIGSIELVLQTNLGASSFGTVAHHQGELSMPVSNSSTLLLHQAFSDAWVAGAGSVDYLPHLPQLESENSTPQYVQEGYRISLDDDELHAFGDSAEFPAHGWLDLSGTLAGVTMAMKNMSHFWPAALQARGDGRLSMGLFTDLNPAPYTFVFQQHESRTGVFSFHAGPAIDPLDVARRLDLPVSGRAADYSWYDEAAVFPYRLLTVAQHELAYQLMGIHHKLQTKMQPLLVTRYLGKSASGPTNNHAVIERFLAGEWLRDGHGGQYLTALDLALWKSEWQILRSDDFVYSANQPLPLNDEIPHTTNNFSDDEHRYREGILLAWYLTGDPRYRDALLDEVEVLKQVSLWPHERSMYQTLRAMAYLYEFTGDSELHDMILARLEYFVQPTIKVDEVTVGYGWEDSPDMGNRRYYVNAADNNGEKPPGENFQARGWISASLGPLGLFHIARVLAIEDTVGVLARWRMRDLIWWTSNELFPWNAEPEQRHLVYSYAVTQMVVVDWEQFDFHPILLGMAETFKDTGDWRYLKKGIEQIEAFAAHDNGPFETNLYLLDSRLDCQHFMHTWLNWTLSQNKAAAGGPVVVPPSKARARR
jgi:hypothetical protein